MEMSKPYPPIIKQTPLVWRVMGLNPGPMTLYGSNTYLVGSGKSRALIDSGEGMPHYKAMVQTALRDIEKEFGEPVSISHLFLTHWHPDHVGGVPAIRELFPQVEIYKKPSQYNPVEVDSIAKEPPEIFKVEGATMKVIPCPGHTDDHLCLFLEEEKAMFTGDTVLGEGSSTFSCYREYMASLHLLKSYKPIGLYPAHGRVLLSGAEERIEEMIQHRQKREAQIVDTLSKRDGDMNILQLVRTIYSDTPQELWGAAGLNVFHHLKKLIHEKVIQVVSRPDMELDILSDANDYTLLGEGVKTDASVMEKIFNEFKVKK
ncbi:Metallo-beta-lactamase superfamily/Beta-lactamase associated winged helix domain containing protein, putative [Angomonas deanei]|uniref:Metallo-beta-lactamase superfamily/Beta-lactamase associated winged helix domain containing protein, putative n=1 Tax=Angomonas deanei TaxID=59799 RepID=A0A7G2CNC9_9TRYP|nr:Metallo-beta-lactamase superfamily/Beta-lactamase associated winged helix domain containing protein, putative [Angomonas deanei]